MSARKPNSANRVDPVTREKSGEVLAALRLAQSVVLACHVKPDGDALGSMIGLEIGLRALGKQVTMLSADGVPRIYKFLSGSDRVKTSTDETEFDLAVLLDAGDLERAGASGEALLRAIRTVVIDHHATPVTFGQTRLQDSTAAATAEIIFDLLDELRVEITPDIAEALMCGLLTDTGQFRFPSVTPRVYQIGAELVRSGAKPDRIVSEVFESRTLSAQRLLGRSLANLQTAEDGRIVYAMISRADLEATGASDEATEGVMNGVRVVLGAQMAFLLHELEDGNIRVSLRARLGHDVAKIAATFGGGGHRLAAGCTIPGDLANAEQRLLAEMRRALYGA